MGGKLGILDIMGLPLLECLVLVGIHSYLGLHVLRRKVIFVDLALAQVAALGTTVAFLFHLDPQGPGAYVFSLFFTIIAAAVFSLTRIRNERVPQEAIIGMVYALAAAMSILVVAEAPHGAEHIKEIMTGALLWVKGSEVAAAAAVYALVGLFHFVFRKKFILISENHEHAHETGLNVRLWDFLFYLSFGLVITHSVRTAGVLLVFVFLVVPAIMAMLITNNLLTQLFIGWGVGLLVSLGGMGLSYHFDSATGPTVVSFYGGVLLVGALTLYVMHPKRAAPRAFMTVLAGILVVTLIAGGFWGMGRWMGESDWWSGRDAVAAHHDHDGHDHATGSEQGKEGRSSSIKGLLIELNDADIETKGERVSVIDDPALLLGLLEKAPVGHEETRLVVARRLYSVAPRLGADYLVQLLKSEDALIRSDALDALQVNTEDSFGFDPWGELDGEENRKALLRWQAWCEERAARGHGRHRGQR